MRFVGAFVYGLSGIFFFLALVYDFNLPLAPAKVFFVAGSGLGVAAMYQFVQGIYDLSDKRKMQQAAARQL